MLKAKDNPFSVSCLEKLPFFIEKTSWKTLNENLTRLNYRAAIVGGQGTGKSTLMRYLGPKLEELGFQVNYFQLRVANKHDWPRIRKIILKGIHSKRIVLLDGAEQLNAWQWFLFKIQSRRAAGLIITSHHAGRLPPLITCEPSFALFHQIVSELVTPASMIDKDKLFQIYQYSAGNLREGLSLLYDLFAERSLAVEPQSIALHQEN